MNIFQTVKESVTTRQAAEQYGFQINGNGMMCCPFHRDRHPSMKADKGFYCFACGAKGDVITFVADLFQLAPIEAAKKLAEDFRIPVEQGLCKKGQGIKVVPKRTRYQTEQKMEQWERECIYILSDYLHLLEKWKVQYAPGSPGEEYTEEFVEACQRKEVVDYYLDILVDGELKDRIDFLLENGEEVREIEKRMERYRREYKEKVRSGAG